MKLKALCALVLPVITLVPAVASAHIELQSPKARYTDQKSGPCGRANDTRSANVTTFKPGQTITVEWEETIGHPGHYRIAFDTDGQDDFKDPDSFTDVTSGGPEVLVDGIADKSGNQKYTQTITFPNIECDNCTLQLIQMMTDKPPYGDGNDIYYQCADIVLSNSATATPDAGTRPPTSGGSGDDDDDDTTSDDDDDTGSESSRRVPKSTPEASGCVTTPGSFGASGTTCLIVLGTIALTLGRRRRK